jgi:hypothetical protein
MSPCVYGQKGREGDVRGNGRFHRGGRGDRGQSPSHQSQGWQAEILVHRRLKLDCTVAWDTGSLRGKDRGELFLEVMGLIEGVEFSNKLDAFPIHQ